MAAPQAPSRAEGLPALVRRPRGSQGRPRGSQGRAELSSAWRSCSRISLLILLPQPLLLRSRACLLY